MTYRERLGCILALTLVQAIPRLIVLLSIQHHAVGGSSVLFASERSSSATTQDYAGPRKPCLVRSPAKRIVNDYRTQRRATYTVVELLDEASAVHVEETGLVEVRV